MKKFSMLVPSVIWRIERDPVFPHYVKVFGLLGRCLMQMEVKEIYDGNGNRFEDDVK